MLVVPELETELGTLATRRSAMVRLRGLRQQRDALVSSCICLTGAPECPDDSCV